MKVTVRSPTETIFVRTLKVVVDGIVFAIILYYSYEHSPRRLRVPKLIIRVAKDCLRR